MLAKFVSALAFALLTNPLASLSNGRILEFVSCGDWHEHHILKYSSIYPESQSCRSIVSDVL